MERMNKEFTAQIESLKATVSTGGKFSPLLSEKASCHGMLKEGMMEKPIIMKEYLVDNNDDCVTFDTPPSQTKVIKTSSNYV